MQQTSLNAAAALPDRKLTPAEIARQNAKLDLDRLARFERCLEMASRLGLEAPRYRLDPPLGRRVSVSVQTPASQLKR